MAETKHINKVVYGGKTLIDLTGDTATADKVLKDLTFHDKTGATVTGACTFDVDSGDATVAVAEMLAGKTAYARGTKLTGTMKNNGSVKGSITTKAQVYTIPQGFHDGSGNASPIRGLYNLNPFIPLELRFLTDELNMIL